MQTTRSGRQINPPLPPEPHTLDEAAALRQQPGEAVAESSGEEYPTSDDDLPASTDSGEQGPSILTILKSIPNTQAAHDHEEPSEDEADQLQGTSSGVALVSHAISAAIPLFLPESGSAGTSLAEENTTDTFILEHESGNPLLQEVDLTNSPPLEDNSASGLSTVRRTPEPNQPPSEELKRPMTDAEVQEWTRDLVQDKLSQLQTFSQRGWGTAYRTIAEVQLLLQIGGTYGMVINMALHSMSAGRYLDRDRIERTISFPLLGSYMNGQSPGTWSNKLTFFITVYHFLVDTEHLEEEDLGGSLYKARQAMESWGVHPGPWERCLPNGDTRASYLLKPLRDMIHQYTRSRN
ncbi:hypothetical protein BJ322DRAFT_1113380 [Thelephora terrestris]|uniref:Uncharacterized protein n=1 Tax=Thelephora terrestris TaxID=56493 RepID=A0A9P6H5C0_9AGAM|nr:hypothetical protein BJ322DRAFT_1113380 [Thelephora terrestris]